MDIVMHNRNAWDKQVELNNKWTVPVSTEEVDRARNELKAEFLLTPTIHVPEEWYANVKEKNVLCLASGGGQQGPLFAALGANVTVFDNSLSQLRQDEFVAKRDDLKIKTVQGDMKDLSCFADETFDLIFHPVSNCFVDDVIPVWREAYRVLRHGGTIIAGFTNPVIYIFDFDKLDAGEFDVKYKIPYSDIEQLTKDQLEQRIRNNEILEYGHSLEDQIGGQLKAGFHLIGLYEDDRKGCGGDLTDKYIKTFIATRALKI